MNDCTFCKIISKEIPNFTILENSHTLAFLDIMPMSDGAIVIIPKKHTNHLWDMPNAQYQSLLQTSKKVALHMRKQLAADRIAMIVEGQQVAHAHIKLIPLANDKKLSDLQANQPTNPVDQTLLEEMQKKLRLM